MRELTLTYLFVCLSWGVKELTLTYLFVCLFEFEKSSADSNIGFVEEGPKCCLGQYAMSLGLAGKNLLELVDVISSPP